MNRRLFLRSAAATLWLPMLPSALPRAAWGAPSNDQPKRLLFWFVPNGFMEWSITPPVEPFYQSVVDAIEPMRDRISQVSGLKNYAIADYASHEAGTSCLLTDVPIGGRSGALSAGISVDQVAAESQSLAMPARSLQLGLDEPGILTGGTSQIYTEHISWAANSTPLPRITSPRRLFQRIYAGSDPVATAENDALRLSILDAVLDRSKDLEKKLGVDDKRKLDQYNTSVREMERRLNALDEVGPLCPEPGPPPVEREFHKAYRAMADLTVLAMQCDYTRIVSFMSGPSATYTVYRHLGHTQDHHTLSHSSDGSEGRRQFAEIHAWHVQQMVATMQLLADIPEGDGDMLDNTVMTLVSEFGDPNRHGSNAMTFLMGGGEGGGIRQGRHIQNNQMPHSNYYRALLEFMGSPDASRFGPNATGTLRLT
ncbi:MAG: DUF1552 domain-containing protein [Myxococcales bacterium]|nr:DUF1552 domain-containing protein [Myxococcales bacterium]